jgi:hypothetical protein
MDLQANRALIAWMDKNFATRCLLGGKLQISEDDIANQQSKIERYRHVKMSRPPFTSSNPCDEIQDNALLNAINARDDIRIALSGYNWQPVSIKLKHVLSFQTIVNLTNLDKRIENARTSKEHLFNLCFPLPQMTTLPDLRSQQTGKFALSTPNFNITITDIQMNLNVSSPLGPKHTITYSISARPDYLQVAHYKGRYFLGGGYHRAIGLLKYGIQEVPGILIDVENLAEMGWGDRAGYVSGDDILGDYPPRLADFWDDSLSYTATLPPPLRRVIRIVGEEFYVGMT